MSITKISPSVVDFDDGITITVDDNSAALTLKSTDSDASIGPILDLSRDNSSAADGDVTGTIRFVSDDDANNQTTYVQLVSKIVDASNSTEACSLAAEEPTRTLSFPASTNNLCVFESDSTRKSRS